MKSAEELRLEISALVNEYAELKYKENTFKPGRSIIPASGKVIGSTELQYMVDASLDVGCSQVVGTLVPVDT